MGRVFETATTLGLAPVLLGQALGVRRRALVLPEPPGSRMGQIGSGPPLRLLITGDSSAAGVGAPTQDAALSGQLVRHLAARYEVTWSLVAKTGATTASALRRIERLPAQRFDVAVTCLGVNDVTRLVGTRAWRARQVRLFDRLLQDFGVRRIYASGLPPMGDFPILPQPLAGVLGRRAARYDAALAHLAAIRPELTHMPFDLPFDAGMMAADGFHPGPPAYEIWAARIAERIATDLRGTGV